MKQYLFSVILVAFSLAAVAAPAKEERSKVLMQTSMGDITIEKTSKELYKPYEATMMKVVA